MIENAKVIGANVRNEDYRRQQHPRGHPFYVMGRSDLMDFAFCPQRWKNGFDSADTEATEWGSMIDCMVLQPERFDEQYAIHPDTYPNEKKEKPPKWTFAATYCKEWRKGIGNKLPVGNAYYQSGLIAVERLRADPKIKAILESSHKQVMVTATWADEDTGLKVPLKTLIDLAPKEGNTLADLKTARCAHPGIWPRVMWDRGYDAQAALYLDLFNAANNTQRTDWFFIIQENKPPYQTARHLASQEFIQLGRDRYTSALKAYCRCLKTGNWPGYELFGRMVIDSASLIEPAPWMLTDISQMPADIPLEEEQEGKPKESEEVVP